MKNENTTLLEVFTHPGTYQIEINGEVITNYLYYLHMMIDFQPSILADKAKSISTLTGDISNQGKFTEVINTILGNGYQITSVCKIDR